MTVQRQTGMHNRLCGSGRKSAGFIVAWKRGNARGAKGLCQIRATVRGRGNRLDPQDPTTDNRWGNLSGKLTLLRRALRHRAKPGGQQPRGCAPSGACLRPRYLGTPDAGNPHVRCDEGGAGSRAWHAAIETRTGKPRHGVCRSLNAVYQLLYSTPKSEFGERGRFRKLLNGNGLWPSKFSITCENRGSDMYRLLAHS